MTLTTSQLMHNLDEHLKKCEKVPFKSMSNDMREYHSKLSYLRVQVKFERVSNEEAMCRFDAISKEYLEQEYDKTFHYTKKVI